MCIFIYFDSCIKDNDGLRAKQSRMPPLVIQKQDCINHEKPEHLMILS
jgi:hypothetical protein